jgi:hypothetical protein
MVSPFQRGTAWTEKEDEEMNSIYDVVDTVCDCKLSLHFPLYEVCLKSNDTKRVARELAKL